MFLGLLIALVFLSMLIFFVKKVLHPFVTSYLLYPRKRILRYLKDNDLEYISHENFQYKESPFYGNGDEELDIFNRMIYITTFYKINIKEKRSGQTKELWVIFKKSGGLFYKDKISYISASTLPRRMS